MNLEQFASRGFKAQRAVDKLVGIAASTDVPWLRDVMADKERPLTERAQAQRRLRELQKKSLGGTR